MLDTTNFKEITQIMLFAVILQPNDWTTNSTVLAWISVISLIIGVISIIVSIIVGYLFYRKGKGLKLITYEILADAPIMGVPVQAKTGKITVLYQDIMGNTSEINDAKILSLKVQNSGNEDVKIWHSEDKDIENMEEPIEFEFEGRTVVCLTQVKTEPSTEVIQENNFRKYITKPSSVPNRLGLPRCLLKTNQVLMLGVLLKGSGRNVKKCGKLYNGNIENIDDLEKRKRFIRNIILITLVSGIFAVLFGILLLFPNSFTSIASSIQVLAATISVLTGFLVIVGYFIPVIQITRKWRQQKRR